MYLSYKSLISWILIIVIVSLAASATAAFAAFAYQYQYRRRYESFATTDPITVSENVLNIKDANKETVVGNHIIVESNKLADIIDKVKKNNVLNKSTIAPSIDPEVSAALPSNANIQLLIDPYINYYVLKNKDADVKKFKEGIFVCISHKVLRTDDCIWDLKGKVVAYLFMSDYLFIQALLKGYNLDINDVYIKKITFTDLANTEKIFDYLFTYMVVDSEYMNFICSQRYYINGMKDVDINRIKAYYPFITENYNTVKYYYRTSKKANLDPKDALRMDDTNNNDIYVSSTNSLLPIMRYNIVSTVENFITRLEMPEDYLGATKEVYYKTDSKASGKGTPGVPGGFYGCYGNGEITNKFECDSYYNIDGTPKTYYSLWDKKCVADEDCPYYKSNRNYPNNRGGCITGGFCEFPVGVKRLGFTKYTDTNLNTPLCYNCGEKDRDTKPEDAKPDYVFANDFEERTKNNLNTIISLLDYRGL
jgi:hypothetical protein